MGLFFGFVYAPLPGLVQPGAGRAEAAEIEARALAWFAEIEEGELLDRPFPAMLVRDDNPVTDARVELGRLLFFDPLLSAENKTSCAHCHHPDLGFADGRRLSMGFGGEGVGPERTGGVELPRNTPTVWNAAYSAAQFWDGRATDLEDQATNPIQHPDEMGQDPEELERELRAVPEYVERFDAAFGGSGGSAVTFQNVSYAIAAFERTVVTHDSPFDRYARGDATALTDSERRGLNLFRSLKTRCFECHGFPTFNNPDFKVIGVPVDEGAEGAEPDPGRGAIAGAGYEHAFKVPTLRNVALTAPYMHNGVFGTLEEVLDFYAEGGGRARKPRIPEIDDKIRAFDLAEREKADLVAFLHAPVSYTHLTLPTIYSV